MQKESDLAVNQDHFLSSMFYGIKLCNQQTGEPIPNRVIHDWLLSAQSEVENFLQLKLLKTIVVENNEYWVEDWRNFGLIKTTYPAIKAYEMSGYFNTIRQIEYPKEWLSVSKSNDEKIFKRSVNIVPAGTTSGVVSSVAYLGVSPHMNFFGMNSIPNYWRTVYATGFDKIPADIMKAIYYIAAIPIYLIIENIIITPGINSESISIDGLSQSRSSQGYLQKVKQLSDELVKMKKELRNYYVGLLFTTV